MNKLPFPVQVHSGLKLVVTQHYGNPSNVEYYKQNGINMPFHNGVDVVLSGDNLKTFGTAIVCPSDGWLVRKAYWYDDPISANGNELVIWSPVIDGEQIELRFVHLSEIIAKEGDILPKGYIMGYIGNSGLVSPKPTPEKPCSGTHLHLGMCIYKDSVLQDAKNGVYGLIDPLTRLDINNPFKGEDTGLEKDVPAFKWAFEKKSLTENWQKIVFALINWLKK